MGIAERKEREKEQRRNDILDAAEKVFFSKGVDKATMDDVAEVSELSKGTLYLYFKNKEELYLGIHIRGFSILNDMFCKAIDGTNPGIEKVRDIGKAYFKFSVDYPNYFNALLYFETSGFDFSDEDSLAYQCHLQGEKCMECVTKAIQFGIDDGTIRSDVDAKKTAWLLWGISSGVIQNLTMKREHLVDIHGINPEEIVEEFFGFVFTALASGARKS